MIAIASRHYLYEVPSTDSYRKDHGREHGLEPPITSSSWFLLSNWSPRRRTVWRRSNHLIRIRTHQFNSARHIIDEWLPLVISNTLVLYARIFSSENEEFELSERGSCPVLLHAEKIVDLRLEQTRCCVLWSWVPLAVPPFDMSHSPRQGQRCLAVCSTYQRICLADFDHRIERSQLNALPWDVYT